jgi:hypothetical protein
MAKRKNGIRHHSFNNDVLPKVYQEKLGRVIKVRVIIPAEKDPQKTKIEKEVVQKT